MRRASGNDVAPQPQAANNTKSRGQRHRRRRDPTTTKSSCSREHPSFVGAALLTMLSSTALLLLLLTAASLLLFAPPALPAARAAEVSDYLPVDVNDGPANLEEGRRLFGLGRYDEASAHLWRAVLLHSQGGNSEVYKVDDAFTPFLQCYMLRDKIVDGLVFISAESYMRGQDAMGELYLGQALERNAAHEAAVELQQVTAGKSEGSFAAGDGLRRLKEIRDKVDASNPANKRENESDNDTQFWGQFMDMEEDDGFWSQFAEEGTKAPPNAEKAGGKSPEEIYNLGTVYFNNKDLVRAEQLFELSCQKSQRKLSVACTNAVYLRTNLCDWEGFDTDMEIIKEVTKSEARIYKSLDSSVTDQIRRISGMGYNAKYGDGVIHWQRTTSVHPHMMLGYPLGNDNAMLKRYAAESMASLDELHARADSNGKISERPADLPFSVDEMRAEFLERHNMFGGRGATPPIKVGFVACSFNSKAVLYLSHDMFRFFDPSKVEVHVFSTGPPDHPQFIQGTMRGVDWRQRVIDAVDVFHDVQRYKGDHVGLARYIHDKEISILIEWDGYARQGDRAAGLMALRPSPIQILHQEFLMTSGAQYFDYIVTDEVVSPERLEGLYTEKFLYMPNHFFSKGHAVQKEVVPPRLEYVPREFGVPFRLGVGTPQQNACLSDNPLGADGSGREVSFVYCNFNKFLKYNPETTKSWIRILKEVPDSILCLLENPKDGVGNLRHYIRDTLHPHGREMDKRIHFIQWEKNPFDHQQRSRSLCNAMLDSHPYNGHTTAQDALYAGVPIVTRSDGDDMASRVTTSANIVLGLEELNAYGGVGDYEDIAIRLGTDATWFDSLRTRLIESCLMKNPMHPYWDVPRYVDNFQKGLKMVWDRFIRGDEMDHVRIVDNARGTMEAELVAMEESRRDAKRKRVKDGEL